MRLIILMAAVVCPLFAATEWLKLTSSNFEMYSTADDKDARRTLEYFEQVRDFFMRVKSQQVTTRLPVTLVVFKNQKEYRPYSPHETAAAYYMGDEHRDYIVMGGAGQEQYPVAVHEYMHLLVRHSGLKMPVWLNEGMAEVYSTLKPLGGKILVGTPPQNRAYPLSQQKWIPIDRLLAVAHDSPEYNEKNRTGLFYAESWLLTHMLMLDNKYGQSVWEVRYRSLQRGIGKRARFSAYMPKRQPMSIKIFSPISEPTPSRGSCFRQSSRRSRSTIPARRLHLKPISRWPNLRRCCAAARKQKSAIPSWPRQIRTVGKSTKV